MPCSTCGAMLRPNARFCNVCGASQVGQTDQAVATRDAPSSSAPDDAGARMKRPPRPLRPDAEPAYSVSGAQAVSYTHLTLPTILRV